MTTTPAQLIRLSKKNIIRMQEKDIVLLYIIVFELFTFLKHTIVFKYFF